MSTKRATLGATGGLVRARRGPGRRSAVGAALVLPAATLIAVIFVAPMVLSFVMSMYDWPLLGERVFTGVANYVDLFTDPAFGKAMGFTGLFAVVVVPLTLVIGLALALLVQRKRRGVGAIRTAIFAPVAIGYAAASYMFLALTNPSTGLFGKAMTDVGITERPPNWLLSPTSAMILVVVVTLWKTVGFAMVALMTGLQAIDVSIEDAARVDGAGWWRTLVRIKLALMKNSIAFATTFTAIGTFLAFDQLFILTGGAPNNSTVTAVFKIYNTAFVQRDLGYAAAMSMVFLVVLLMVTGAQLRLLRKGDYR
ncbi:MAG: sugar ABC transporter permease [Bifidobacteriaceae bacterium]|jgi:multiple sugar transport system permease protein|nr:sugar ABC transporter permease [Bifidobacteriaceae bacterium]